MRKTTDTSVEQLFTNADVRVLDASKKLVTFVNTLVDIQRELEYIGFSSVQMTREVDFNAAFDQAKDTVRAWYLMDVLKLLDARKRQKLAQLV